MIDRVMAYNQKYEENELIGKGHYGRVYRVVSKLDHNQYVAKKIQLEGMAQDERQKSIKEVEIHKSLKHKHILDFKEFFLDKDCLIMIMDYCEFGDLSVYIRNRKQQGDYFDEALIANLFMQLLFGLNYLHENKVLHRDLKTQNIFIDSEGTLKLADFGISKILDHTQMLASTVVGTPFYLSPEACSNQGYNFKSDIWSLGCILYELCALSHAFQGDNILILAKNISSQEPQPIPSHYSKELSLLISWLLRKRPEDRPTIRQIMESEFVKKYQSRFHSSPQKKTVRSSSKTSQQFPVYETQTNLYSESSAVQKKQINQIRSNEVEIISPKKSSAETLKEKCIQKMGYKLYHEMYSLMRECEQNNKSQMETQKLLKQMYKKSDFELSMMVAQVIYLEDSQRF